MVKSSLQGTLVDIIISGEFSFRCISVGSIPTLCFRLRENIVIVLYRDVQPFLKADCQLLHW
jgi:hypothetical protein